MAATAWSERFAGLLARRIAEDPQLAAQIDGDYALAIDGAARLAIAIRTQLALSTERAPCAITAQIQARDLLQVFNGTLSGAEAVGARRLILHGNALDGAMLTTVPRLFRAAGRPIVSIADYMNDAQHGLLPTSGLSPVNFSDSIAIEALGDGGGYWRIFPQTRARVRPAESLGARDLAFTADDASALLAGDADPVQLFARFEALGIAERARGLAVLLADRRAPTGEVGGRFVDQHGRQQDEILVSVTANRDGEVAGQTLASGRYRLSLPTGAYQLVFESTAFAEPVCRTITIGHDRQAEVDVVVPRNHRR